MTTSVTDDRSYHDIHITTSLIARTSIFDLPYGLLVTCSRVNGWRLYRTDAEGDRVLAGEFEDAGLRLDVDGHVIIDSMKERK